MAAPASLAHSPPHAVLFPYPAQGHINPMMLLAQTLASKGFLITFVTIDIHLHCITHQSKLPQSSTMNIRLAGLDDGLPPHHSREPDADFTEIVHNLQAPFQHLVYTLTLQQPPVSCIISDSYLPWTQDTADKLNIPRILFWTQSAAVYSCYANINQIITNHGFHPFKHRDSFGLSKEPMDLITCIPGLPSLLLADLPFFARFKPNISEDDCVKIVNWLSDITDLQFKRRNEAVWVICNSFYDLESKVFEALQTDHVQLHPIGPLLPFDYTSTGSSLWQEDNECMQWLDTQADSSVLFISFGSVTILSAEQLSKIALGVADSEQPFLWATRMEDVSKLLPEGFLESTKQKGRIVKWTSQIRVLGHRAVGAFFSHCGWNSTVESISMGVPILACPQFLDQFTNSWYIVNEWKVGVELKRRTLEEVERQDVERGVRLLMQQEEGTAIKKRVEELSVAAKRAAASGGNLDLLVEDLVRRAHQQLKDLSPPSLFP